MKYAAFISYSHKDKAWGEKLHRALERYRVPKRIRGIEGRDGPVPERIFPVFRDRDELPSSSDLNEQIAIALRESATLIVICSPRAAASRWVNEEIRLFKAMGRANRILAVIIDGEPNASDTPGASPEDECFPPALRYRIGPDGALSGERVEPVAADVRPDGDGEENARLKVIAGVLGIGFDQLRQRDLEAQRSRLRKLAAISGAIALALTGLLVLSIFFARQARDERDRALRNLGDSYAERARAMVRARRYDAAARLAVIALRLSGGTSDLAAVVLRQAGPRVALRARYPLNADAYARGVLSPGHRVIATPIDNEVLLWNIGPSELKLRLQGHSSTVRSVSFSADGARIVTASDDGTARVWDSTSGASIAILKDDEDDIFEARYWRDGGSIVTASTRGTIRVWDAATHRPIASAAYHELHPDRNRPDGQSLDEPSFAGQIDVASDGRRILVVDHSVAVYDFDGSARLRARVLTAGGVKEARLSPDGRFVVVNWSIGGFQVWSTETGEAIKIDEGASSSSSGVFAISFDGTRLAYASKDGADVYDLEAGTSEVVAPARDTAATALRFSPAGGKRIAIAGEDGDIKVFERQPEGGWSEYISLGGHVGEIHHLDFTDGETLLSSSLDGTVREWRLARPQPTQLLTVPVGPPGSDIAIAGRRTFIAGTKELWVVDLDAPDLRYERHPSKGAGGLYPSRTGDRIAHSNETLSIIDVATGRTLDLQGSDGVLHVDWSPDGATVAGASGERGAILWNSANGVQTEVFSFTGGKPVTHVSYSHDGKMVVLRSGADVEVRGLNGRLHVAPRVSYSHVAVSPSAGELLTAANGLVQLLDLATAGLKRTFAHGRGVIGSSIMSVAFSPDGALALSSGDDRTARVWDLRSDSSLLRYPLTGSWLTACLGFLPGSNQVMIPADDGMRILDIGTGELVMLLPHMYECPAFTADRRFAVGRPIAQDLREPDMVSGGVQPVAIVWDTSRLAMDVQELTKAACDYELPSTARTFTRAEAETDRLIHNLRVDDAGREIDVCTGKARD